MNAVVPAFVAERYAGARTVVFSTGNVYPLTPPGGTGAREDDAPAPVGEYAKSCLGRERMFEYFAGRDGTRLAIVRLNYAHDLRYGVLTDLARRIWAGEPVDLTMGSVNVIWQGDANGSPSPPSRTPPRRPFVVNVAGTETLSRASRSPRRSASGSDARR